jgi:hypothetical protein
MYYACHLFMSFYYRLMQWQKWLALIEDFLLCHPTLLLRRWSSPPIRTFSFFIRPSTITLFIYFHFMSCLIIHFIFSNIHAHEIINIRIRYYCYKNYYNIATNYLDYFNYHVTHVARDYVLIPINLIIV